MEANEDWTNAIEYARRLASVRPTDATAALRLMRLLAAAGDRAAAIAHAQAYGNYMRDQMEVEPDATVTTFAAQLKAAPALVAVATQAGVAGPMPRLVEAAAGSPTALSAPTKRAPLRYVLNKPIAWALGGVAVFALALFAMLLSSRDPQELVSLQQPLVVAPFRVLSANSELRYLGEGMIELLSTRLADDPPGRSMDASPVIRAWRSAGITGANGTSVDTVLSVARKLGAKRVILGSVIGGADRAILNASIVDVASGSVTTQASVEGSTDTLTALVDQLARRLLLLQAADESPPAGRTAPALPALRAYLSGIGSYARGDYLLARTAFERAMQLDSTFALAALRLSMTAGRLADYETQRAALHQAWRYQDDLGSGDRAFLNAQLGPRYPRLSHAHELVTAWTNATRATPGRPEAWYGLANVLAHRSKYPDGDADDEGAVAALDRTLELDSEHARAHILLARIRPSHSAGDTGTHAATSAPVHFADWLTVAQRDSLGTHYSFDVSGVFGPSTLRAIALASQYLMLRLDDGQRILDVLQGRAADLTEAMGLLVAQHSLALNRGQPQQALEITGRMQRLSPATRAHLRLRVLDALYGGGDDAAALTAAQRLAAAHRDRLPNSSADACVLAQWQLRQGDTLSARALLKDLSKTDDFTPVIAGTAPQVCADLIAAALAVRVGAPDAHARMLALDSLMFTTVAAGDAAAYAHLAIAELFQHLDEPALALAALRKRPIAESVWPRYLASSLRMEQQLAPPTTATDSTSVSGDE
jgi:tetratricopeptide (TPR) repeat protein